MNGTDLLNYLGSKVSFSSILPGTEAVITGKLVNMGDYDSIRNAGYDIDVNNAAINRTLATADAINAALCMYVVVQSSSSGTRRAFATSWVTNGSVQILDATCIATIELTNVTTAEVDKVVRYAAEEFIAAKVVSTIST